MMMNWIRAGLLVILLTCGSAKSACETALDAAYRPQFEISGTVLDAAVQPDNRTVVVGYFKSVDGVRRSGIARLNADGSPDTGFQLNVPVVIFEAYYQTVAVDGQGRILLSGQFQFLADPADFTSMRQYLVRLAPDGTLDPTFDAGNYTTGGIDGVAHCIVEQADGKLLIGGDFHQIHGVARAGIARLNPDGSLDESFDPGAGADGTVSAILLQSDGSVVIGGSFSHVDGQVRNGLARLSADGTLDENFAVGASLGTEVHALAELTGGQIVAGGRFAGYALTILDSDGNPTGGVAVEPFHEVDALAAMPDGSFVAGGWNPVTYFNGKPTGHEAEVVSYSAAGAAMNSHRFEGEPTDVFALARRPDGKVVCAGSFRMDIRFEGQPVRYRHGICLLGDYLNPVDSFDPVIGAPGTVHAVVVEPDGAVVVGGNFNLVNGTPRNNLVRIKDDGSLDDSFDPGADFPVVVCMVRQNDGKLVLGTDGDWREVRRLMEDGSADDTFQPYRMHVMALALDAGQRILAGGTADASFRGLTRLLPDGTPDTDFDVGEGLSNSLQPGGYLDEITALAVQDDGKILVGGSFDSFDETPRSKIVRLLEDGAVDGTFVPPAFAISSPVSRAQVHALQVLPGGSVLAGGDFSTVGDTETPLLAKLNDDGSLDASFASPFVNNGGPVRAFLPMPDGGILVGGRFQHFAPDGTPYNGIVKIFSDGRQDPSFCGMIGYDGWDVRALARGSDDRILAAGAFSAVDGQPRSGLAAYVVSKAPAPPQLRISVESAGKLELRWPADAEGYHAESSDSLSGGWSPVTESPVREGDEYVLKPTVDGKRKFFRLVGP